MRRTDDSPESAKPMVFAGSSREDLREMPPQVRSDLGNALWNVQRGLTPDNAKPLKGYRGAGVLEVIEDYDSDTYRAVYTVRFAGVVYVLHVFQKKSTHGIRTLPRDLRLVEQRIQWAERHYREQLGRGE